MPDSVSTSVVCSGIRIASRTAMIVPHTRPAVFAARAGLQWADAVASPWKDVRALSPRDCRFVKRTLRRLGVGDQDLDDQAQEVLIVVLRRLDVSELRTTLHAWLGGVCRRVAADVRRRAYRRREVHDATALACAASEAEDPEASVARAELYGRIAGALTGLSPPHAAVLRLVYDEGLSCSVTAERLGVPTGTVYSRLHGARAELMRALNRPPDVAPQAPMRDSRTDRKRIDIRRTRPLDVLPKQANERIPRMMTMPR